MVSAEMLARLEARCRQLVLDSSATKYGKHNHSCVAPFGGLNLILSGDFWQLPPPRGTFLGQIPWQLVTGVSCKEVAAQLARTATRMSFECKRRTQDVWLKGLQAELRVGRLSADNASFLHGKLTKVPGSWRTKAQKAMCGRKLCQRLCEHGASACIFESECEICHAEQESKRLVAVGLQDLRFAADFGLARGIFHTNGVKCIEMPHE